MRFDQGGTPDLSEPDDPSNMAWAHDGIHAHRDGGWGWVECACVDEALRPSWARCTASCDPAAFHFHQPPEGSSYPDPPIPGTVKRLPPDVPKRKGRR